MSEHKRNVGAVVVSKGVSFRVWAPFADSVDVVGDFTVEPIAMKSEGDGYWHCLVKQAMVGQKYQYAVHRNEQIFYRNDPMALYMPTAKGPSVIPDTSFDWQDDSFVPPPLNQQIIYELHVGTFYRPNPSTQANFENVIEKLDHLAELGINMIELMPISAMYNDQGWGYAPIYIHAIESIYGGLFGFKTLVREAHKRGIGVIVDVVYNHFYQDIEHGLWRFDGWYENDGGGIYFYNDWRGNTPWGLRPDFGRPEVRQYLLDNALMFLSDCHVDSLRLDSTHYLHNVKGNSQLMGDNLPEAWNFMQGLNQLAKSIDEHKTIIAEDHADNEYITKPISQGGAGFDAQWDLGCPYVLRDTLWSSNASEINLAGLLYLLNHRFNDRAFERIGFVDSHDSAANGMVRFSNAISPKDPESKFAKQRQLIAFGIITTAPLVPMLLQGQEFMEAGDFNDWRSLDWRKSDKHQGIVLAHQHLISLRKNTANVSSGLLGEHLNVSHIDDNNKVVAYHRWDNGGPGDDVVVVINCSNQSFESYEIGFPRNGLWRVRFNSTWAGYSDDFSDILVADVFVDNGRGCFNLPENCILILSQDS
ncbi:alpha amylase C-terminal domain-containing protein [Candidatus Nomurabacteria bacterium]|nr:alpha amylase C-terminal domain-containing protein [Candidatus Nomurabacteria bacterium]